MAQLTYRGRNIELDSEGFLREEQEWNEEIAKLLAKKEGIDHLSTEQFKIIAFMREYFHEYKVFPILNNLCKINQREKKCVTEQFVNPEAAWKIAGLPKPAGIHFISLDGKHYKMETCC